MQALRLLQSGSIDSCKTDIEADPPNHRASDEVPAGLQHCAEEQASGPRLNSRGSHYF